MDRQTVHVLDDRFCPVAPGEVGQICYGGAGLARGYWRRPELTRERFIDAANVAPRLYCSGDLGRMRPDGVVELLGRMDRQVKIRGYRVELGEIESALLRHPAVRHNAVIADRAGAGTDQLIAFIVGTNGEAPTPNELRRFLAAQLPDYMVPARFFHLDSLPLTDNQKVDRAALSAVAAQRRALATPSGEQASAFERRLLRLWETVLAQSGLGIDDKFFEIGGDSLSAAKLVARIEREFGRQISLDTLLEQPTVRQLAQLLETSPSANAGGATSPRQGCLADKRLVRANHNQAVTAPAASRDGKRHPPIATRGATSYTRRVTEIGSNWKRTLRRFLRTILGDFNG
jgi:acyl carrier protein